MIKKLWAFLPVFAVNGQDVATYTENLKKDLRQSEISLTGYCQEQAALNTKSTQGRDLFTNTFSGLITVNYAKRLSCPIQFYSNNRQNKLTYQSPFTFPTHQIGLSPSYKNNTVYVGFKTLSLSEHSLNGIGYNGLGAHIKNRKSNLEWTMVYGNFQQNTLNRASAYKRNGICTKLKLGKLNNWLSFVICQWRDALLVVPTNSPIQSPEENLVLGLQSAIEFRKWQCSVDLTQSHYTYNLLQPISRKNRFTYFNEYYNARQSTRTTHALQFSINRVFKAVQLAWHLKKIDPGFNSMGIGFMNGDQLSFQQICNWHTTNHKFKINSDVAYLKNNLDHAQKSTLHRVSAQHQLAVRLSEQHTFQINHLMSYNNQKPIYQTIHQLQMQFGYAKTMGEKILQISWQETYQSNQANENSQTRLYAHTLHFNLHQPNKKSQNTLGYTLQQLLLNANLVNAHNLFITLNRVYLKNKLSISTSCFIQKSNQLPSVNFQLQGRYNLSAQQAITLSSQYQFQNQSASNQNMYRFQLTYLLNFKPKSFSREK